MARARVVQPQVRAEVVVAGLAVVHHAFDAAHARAVFDASAGRQVTKVVAQPPAGQSAGRPTSHAPAFVAVLTNDGTIACCGGGVFLRGFRRGRAQRRLSGYHFGRRRRLLVHLDDATVTAATATGFRGVRNGFVSGNRRRRRRRGGRRRVRTAAIRRS